MTLVIDLPKELEAALQEHALAQGVNPAGYARLVLERALRLEKVSSGAPFKTGRGMLARYGPAPSGEEIDANRVDMFGGFADPTP